MCIRDRSGNYLALKIDAEPVEAKTVVEFVGGTKGPITLDEDRNLSLIHIFVTEPIVRSRNDTCPWKR